MNIINCRAHAKYVISALHLENYNMKCVHICMTTVLNTARV